MATSWMQLLPHSGTASYCHTRTQPQLLPHLDTASYCHTRTQQVNATLGHSLSYCHTRAQSASTHLPKRNGMQPRKQKTQISSPERHPLTLNGIFFPMSGTRLWASRHTESVSKYLKQSPDHSKHHHTTLNEYIRSP